MENMKWCLLIICVIYAVGAEIANEKSCLDDIKELSNYDAKFGYRVDIKRAIAKNTSSAEEFERQMILCGGYQQLKDPLLLVYSCGAALSWVTEVFEGLMSQYTEYKYDKHGPKAGYSNYIGDSVYNVFRSRRGEQNRVIFRCQHVGTADHVFTIEQVPAVTGNNGGSAPMYRIYQSYKNAYSMKAWLSDTLTQDLYDNKDLMIPEMSRCLQTPTDTSSLCAGFRASFDGLEQLINAGGGGQALLDFQNLVLTYNISTTESFFKPAWNSFGQARLLSEAEFQGYLTKTAAITTYLNTYSNTSTPHSATIYQYWIDLYGSPDPIRFPGVPANFLNMFWDKTIDYYQSGYGFEIKAVLLSYNSESELNSQCGNNAAILLSSLSGQCMQNNSANTWNWLQLVLLHSVLSVVTFVAQRF